MKSKPNLRNFKNALERRKFLEKVLEAKIIYVGTGPEAHHVVERYWK